MQNRTNLLDVCKNQLEQLYADLTQHHTRIYAIRQWCITVWLATLAITASGKLDLNIMQALFLTTAPVAMFWILDGFQSAFVRVNTERAKKLEAMVVDSSALATFGLDHFYVSGYEKIPYRQKFRHFLRALFLSETVFFFYLLLLFGSLVFVIVLGFPEATPG